MSTITDLPYYFSVQHSSMSEDLKNNFFDNLKNGETRLF